MGQKYSLEKFPQSDKKQQQKSIVKPLPLEYKMKNKQLLIIEYNIDQNQKSTKHSKCQQQLQKQDEIKQQQEKKHPKLQVYIIVLNPDQYQSYTQNILFRDQYPQVLVQIPYRKIITPKDSSLYHKFKLYVQYIPITLQKIVNIHYLDMLTIIYWTLKGFQILWQKYGLFAINDQMIGFNETGAVKVWINQKFIKMAGNKGNYWANLNCGINNEKSKLQQQKLIIENLQKLFNAHVDRTTVPDSLTNKQSKQLPKIILLKTFAENILQIQSRSPQKISNYIYPILELLESGRQLPKQGQQISLKNQYYNKNIKKVIKINYETRKGPMVHFNYKTNSNNYIHEKNIYQEQCHQDINNNNLKFSQNQGINIFIPLMDKRSKAHSIIDQIHQSNFSCQSKLPIIFEHITQQSKSELSSNKFSKDKQFDLFNQEPITSIHN